MTELMNPPLTESKNLSIDIRIVGHKEELVDFIRLCKAIQHLGRVGSNRTIKLTVDGDGSGRLAFYSIDGGNEEDKTFIPFPSSAINVDKVEELDMWIGE